MVILGLYLTDSVSLLGYDFFYGHAVREVHATGDGVACLASGYQIGWDVCSSLTPGHDVVNSELKPVGKRTSIVAAVLTFEIGA